MEGFALLLGHLLGDYILQRDWEAKRKSATLPTPPAEPPEVFDGCILARQYQEKCQHYNQANFACTWHCFKYTLAIFLTCWWFLPLVFYPVIFLAHWPVDRYRLARKFMTWNKQEEFATGMFSPWSVIVVDNIMHLAVLFYIGILVVVYHWRQHNG